MSLPSDWKSYSRHKIISPNEIGYLALKLKEENKTIATLNGSFDLLHAGHMYMIFEASKCADVLILAVNSDASIKQYKSKDRPIIPLELRMEMLSAIGFIDFITWFEETDPREILETIKPHVHVNGIEYGPNCIESEVVQKNGGRIHLVDRIPGLATSEIINKVKQCA